MYYKFEEIKQLILDFEDEKISDKEAVAKINQLSSTPVDRHWLHTYWSSISIEEFVKILSIIPIENWVNLNDKESIQLIEEMIQNVVDTALLNRNSEALEKRYQKTSGTVIPLVLADETNAEEILIELKKDTKIYL